MSCDRDSNKSDDCDGAEEDHAAEHHDEKKKNQNQNQSSGCANDDTTASTSTTSYSPLKAALKRSRIEGQSLTTLVISSCGLSDEALAMFFPAAPTATSSLFATPAMTTSITTAEPPGAPLLPHLVLLDVSNNLLRSFPTFVLIGCQRPSGASTSSKQPFPSPWCINASGNTMMKLFPPVVLESPILGFVSIEGCDALSPAAVVAGLKGLVCGDVRIPIHTDKIAVMENMLGVLSINGELMCNVAQAPQHARKCEEHLQQLRRHFNTSSAWFVTSLLSSVKIVTEARHVVHPRLVDKHRCHAKQVTRVLTMEVESLMWTLRKEATQRLVLQDDSCNTNSNNDSHTFDSASLRVDGRCGCTEWLLSAPPSSRNSNISPSLSARSGGGVVPVGSGSLSARSEESSNNHHAVVKADSLAESVHRVAPFFFDKWECLLTLSMTDERFRSISVAIAAAALHVVAPQLCDRSLCTAIMDAIVEDCAVGLRPDEHVLHGEVDALFNTVEVWTTTILECFVIAMAKEYDRQSNTLRGGGGSDTMLNPPPPDISYAWLSTLARGCSSLLALGTPSPSRRNELVDLIPIGAIVSTVSRLPLDLNHMDSAAQESLNLLIAAARRADEDQQRKRKQLQMELERNAEALQIQKEVKNARNELLARTQHYEARPVSRVGSLSQTVSLRGRSPSAPLLGQTVNASMASPSSAVEEAIWQASLSAEDVQEQIHSVQPLHRGFLPSRGHALRSSSAAPVNHAMVNVSSAGGDHSFEAGAGAFSIVETSPPEQHVNQSSNTAQNQRRTSARPNKNGSSTLKVNVQCLDSSCIRVRPASTASTYGTESPSRNNALEHRRDHTEDHPSSPPSSVTQGSSMRREQGSSRADPPHRTHSRGGRIAAKSLIHFLRQEGRLHLQTSSALEAIHRAANMDLSELTQCEDWSSVSLETNKNTHQTQGGSGDVQHGHNNNNDNSIFSSLSRMKQSHHHAPPPPLIDLSALGMTTEEWSRAQKVYNSAISRGESEHLINNEEDHGERVVPTGLTQGQVSITSSSGSPPPPQIESHSEAAPSREDLHSLLFLISQLLAPHSRVDKDGEVLSCFMSLMCVTVPQNKIDFSMATQQERVDLVCRCLSQRGVLRHDYELYAAAYAQLPKTTDAIISPILITSSSVQHQPERSSTDHGAPVPYRNEAPRNDSEQRPSSRAYATVSTEDQDLRSLVHLRDAVSNRSSGPLAALGSSSIRIIDSKQRTVHPFLVQAQQRLESERIRAQLKAVATSSNDEDKIMDRAVRRSCSASLQPLRRERLPLCGRSPDDYIPSNHQFIPSMVREHLARAATAQRKMQVL